MDLTLRVIAILCSLLMGILFFSWGKNDQGQLGDGTQSRKTDPMVMSVLEGKNIIGAACGPSQVCTTLCILLLIEIEHD